MALAGAAAALPGAARAEGDSIWDMFARNRILRGTDKQGNTAAAEAIIETIEPILSVDTAYNLQQAIALYEPFVFVALRRPITTILIGALAVVSAVPLYLRLGSEFMPPLDEGDVLYMPTTLPNLSIEEAKRQLQLQDAALKSFPEVKTVFGKVDRSESATDPAPLSMVETVVQLRPPTE